MLGLALILQVQAADSVYSTAALRDFIAKAAIENRAPPLSLQGYTATVQSELALILRDSLGRELVGQIEQLAARADWERAGRYDLHVVGFRSQSAGAPYSALTFTRMYTVPTLYGNRLVLGMNDGVPLTKAESARVASRWKRDSLAGRERVRAVHPLATDRDRFYTFSGGDTVATMYSRDRAIRLVRVHVEPRSRPDGNFFAYTGELDFDADRFQLVRMRGRLVNMTPRAAESRFLRTTGAVAVAYMEFENAEVNGRYWLPAYQRSEFQAQLSILGDIRPVYRLISRFRNYRTTDSVTTLAEMDTTPRALLPPTRATLTFAARDSVSRFGDWEETLGTNTARVTADDFNDLAPDIWKSTGRPRVDYWPRKLDDVVRFNRVEGMFTGVAGTVRFRDNFPGLSATGNVGWAWSEQTARGAGALSLTRGHWIYGARVERSLASTNDFLAPLDNGLSIGPLLFGIDENDYVDRRTLALSTTRVIGNVDRAMLSVEAALVEDRPEPARLLSAPLWGSAFRVNRGAFGGRYGRTTARIEFHPRVTSESLSPGLGARLTYESASGSTGAA